MTYKSFYCQFEKKNKRRKHENKSFKITKTDEPDGNNWAIITMKKHLLKAALICLGITLLCGLYSFRTLKGEDLQHSYQTVAISNDTIITSEGEESECIQEVVVENEQGDGTCSLYVHYTTENWYLYCCTNGCDRSVEVKYWYKLFVDGGDCLEGDEVYRKRTVVGDVGVGGVIGYRQIDSGRLKEGVFVLDHFEVCFIGQQNLNN